MVNFLAFLFALGVGFGLSFWIFGTLLDKSNNIGDSRGKSIDYNAYVHFTASKDRMSNAERDSFCNTYCKPLEEIGSAPKGTERVRRLSEEEMKAYEKNHEALKPQPVSSQIEGDLTNDGFLDNEDEFQRWEQGQGFGSSQDVFRPINPQQ